MSRTTHEKLLKLILNEKINSMNNLVITFGKKDNSIHQNQ